MSYHCLWQVEQLVGFSPYTSTRYGYGYSYIHVRISEVCQRLATSTLHNFKLQLSVSASTYICKLLRVSESSPSRNQKSFNQLLGRVA